jgi:ankyrin repeat protein
MTAAKAGAEGVLKFLLEKGGNPNHRALNGDTPLISAATYARGAVTDRQHQVALRIVERLIEAGADPNARNNDGKTALSIVKDAESPLVANYLKEFAKPKAKQKK